MGWLPLVWEEYWLPESWGNPIESSFSASQQPLGNLNKFLPADPPSGRLPLLSVTLGACHKSSPSLTLPLDQGESIWERKQPEPGDVLKD